jgi:molybdate transport system substrate-binding protein
LKKAGVWNNLLDRVAGGEDVRSTLALVERGADAGIVYQTDVTESSRVRIAFAIDPTLHKPIEYPVALLERSRANTNAVRFFEYLGLTTAAQEFRKAGFTVK